MKNNFIEYLHKYSAGGKSPSIHIKKKNEGKFTQSAKEHGMGVQEYAQSVLNDPNASALQKKRANFARNAKAWKHEDGAAMHLFTNPYQEEYSGSAESYEPTYDMGELAPVYVTAKATPEERNKAQLRANEQWRQYQENYAEYQKAKNAAELAQQQHDFNAHIRKGMNKAGEVVSAFFPIPGVVGLGATRKVVPAAKRAVQYVAPVAKRTAETVGKFTPKPIKNMGKSLKILAEFGWNPATTTKDLVGDAVKWAARKTTKDAGKKNIRAKKVQRFFESEPLNGATGLFDVSTTHIPAYISATNLLKDRVTGESNWFLDSSGNLDGFNTVGTIADIATFIPGVRMAKRIKNTNFSTPFKATKPKSKTALFDIGYGTIPGWGVTLEDLNKNNSKKLEYGNE